MGQTFAPLKTWNLDQQIVENKYRYEADKNVSFITEPSVLIYINIFGERVRRSEARKGKLNVSEDKTQNGYEGNKARFQDARNDGR